MLFINVKCLLIIYFYYLFTPNVNVLLLHTLFGMAQIIHIICWYLHAATAPEPPPYLLRLEKQMYELGQENDRLTRQVQHLQNKLDDLRYTIDIWEEHIVQVE